MFLNVEVMGSISILGMKGEEAFDFLIFISWIIKGFMLVWKQFSSLTNFCFLLVAF